jgi:hypothetical protein
MPLNKKAPWGPGPLVAAPPPGIAKVVGNHLQAIAAQPSLAANIDGVKAAVVASDANAAIVDLTRALAPLAQLPQAIMSASDVTKLGLQAVAAEIDKLNKSVQSGPGPSGTPSVDAFTILAALGQVRDALCDQVNANLKHTNDLIAKASKSASVQAARARLAHLPEFAAALGRQLGPLDGQPDFETQRRQRLAQLVAFELKVLATIGP